MALTLDSFLAKFPEFNSSPTAYVQRAIDDAVNGIAADVWGDQADEGTAYLAAHKLASGPGGLNVRTESKETGYARTVYGAQYLDMARAVSPMASRVVGGDSPTYATPIG